MKLHAFAPSPNSRKVLFLNTHLGLGIPVTDVDLPSGAQKSDAFLALNPMGKVPVLERDGDTPLWESNAILNHLATRHPGPLTPGPADWAEVMRWQFWESCHLTPACGLMIAHHLFGAPGIDLDAAGSSVRHLAGILDRHLAGRDWLVGDGMSLADVSVAPVLYLRAPCRYPLDGLDHLARWLERVEGMNGWPVADTLGAAARVA